MFNGTLLGLLIIMFYAVSAVPIWYVLFLCFLAVWNIIQILQRRDIVMLREKNKNRITRSIVNKACL